MSISEAFALDKENPSAASGAPVLFVTRKWAPATGGMETYSMKLAESMQRICPVDVVALAGRPDGMPPNALALLLFPFTVLRRLLARGNAPQVLHLGDMALWPLGLLAARGTQIAISAHGTDVAFHRRGGFKGRLYGIYLRLGARMMRRARVIANSRATAKVAAESGWRSAATVPLATDFGPPANNPEQDGAILFAGRLVERKGCGWFIREVLPLLPETLTLKVAGTAWDAAERAMLHHSRVRFLGPLAASELAHEYARSLCVVVPNIEVASREYEGFGLVAPEAASAGGVVLAANHGGLADAVRDGETGFLVAMGDAPAWAERIKAIAGWAPQQRSAFTCAAQSAAQDYYSWDRVARDTLTAYDAGII